MLAAPVGAKTFTVTTRTDPAPDGCKKHDCSLREAIMAANSHSGHDTVALLSKKPYKIELENTGPTDGVQGDLDIIDAVTLEKKGKGMATVDADGIDRAFEVFPNAPTTLRKIKVTGGANPSGVYGGAGILADSDLALIRSAVVGNDDGGGSGGGLIAHEDARVIRSSIANNKAGDVAGGEIGGDAVISRSRITGNTGTNGGAGGIYFYPEGTESVFIDRTTISGNSAGGTFGSGGGIDYAGQVSGPDRTVLKITNSTISGNTAAYDGGGIRHIFGDLRISNSTIAGNHAGRNGGGIDGYGQNNSTGTVSLNAVTVARNTAEFGGGIYNGDGPDGFTVQNSLIALNEAAMAGDDCSADGLGFGSLGHNLLSTGAGCSGFDAPSDLVRADPKIGKLSNNGGPTETIALKNHSAAIGAASKQTAPSRDQRGSKRDKHPDIGAFER